jgi:hypothetical protein
MPILTIALTNTFDEFRIRVNSVISEINTITDGSADLVINSLQSDSLTLAVGSSTVTTILDEDDLNSNSEDALATQQSIKAYVDAQLTSQDLDVAADTGIIAIDLDSETFTISGGTGITSAATGNGVTVGIDNTVTTLTGTQTLTNKTLTLPTINGGTLDATITGVTQTASDNSTKIATTEYTDGAIANLVASSPATLDTLNELASALDDDPNFATTVTNSIALKAPIASPTFTGSVVIDTNTLVVDSVNKRVGILNTIPDVTLDLGSATDAMHIPVGTTAQRPSVSDGGYFRYNTSLSQFEGYTDTWGAIGGGGTNTFTHDNFTGDGSTVDFAISQSTESENNLMVFIEGVFQTQAAYSIATAAGVTTITFSAAPASGRNIIVYTVAAGVSGNNLNGDLFSGDGSAVTFTLSIRPINEYNTQVFVDGVYQQKDTYTISEYDITFATAPAIGTDNIEVMTFTQTEVNVPVNNSIESVHLKGDITTPGALTSAGLLTASAGLSATTGTFSGRTKFGSAAVLPGFAGASDVALLNEGAIRGTNAAASTSFALIKLTSADKISINSDGASEVLITGATTFTSGITATTLTATTSGLTLQAAAVTKASFNVAVSANQGVTGTAIGDQYNWTTGGAMLWSTNNGTTTHLKLAASTGDATFSGNVGVGVTPSDWDGIFDAIDVGQASNGVSGNSGTTQLTQGIYYNAGYKYGVSSIAVGRYEINLGVHKWTNAVAGTAGNALTAPTSVMTLDASGNLGVGHTPATSAIATISVATAGNTWSAFGDGQQNITSGAYYSVGGWRGTYAGSAMRYQQYAGVHRWFSKTVTDGGLVAGNWPNSDASMTLDASGNLGVGVVPAMSAPYQSIQIGTGNGVGVIAARTDAVNAVNFGLNWDYDGGSNLLYKESDFATNYRQISGKHEWNTVVSGTAGAAINWSTPMTLDASGKLGIGWTTNAAYSNLQVKSAASAYAVDIVGNDASGDSQLTFWNADQTAIVSYIGNQAAGARMSIVAGAGRSLKLGAGGTDGHLIIDSTGDTTFSGNVILTGGAASPGSLWKSGANLVVSMDTGGLYVNNAADTLSLLHITDAGAATLSGNLGIGVTPNAGWGSFYSVIDAGAAGNQAFFTGQTNAIVANMGVNLYNDNTNFRYSASGTASMYQHFSGQHRWFSAASGTAGAIATLSQNMTLDASGNLSVAGAATFSGTSVTSNDGDVRGKFIMGGATYNGSIEHDASTTGANIYTVATASGGGHIFRRGAVDHMTLDASGNLGVGVTPSAWSSAFNAIQGGAGAAFWSHDTLPYVYLSSNVYFDGVAYRALVAGEGALYQQASGGHTWSSSASVGVGAVATMAPKMTLAASGGLYITSNYAGWSSSGSMGELVSGDHYMRNGAATANLYWLNSIDTSNNYRIGNASAVGVYLGDGNTTWSALSDERFKDIIEPITDGLEKVSRLRAVIGKYKTDEEGKRRSFLIAQDVLAELPEAVDAQNPDELGLMGVDVIPLLVSALHDAKTLIESLTARLDAAGL